MVDACLGATQDGNHHTLQEHELRSSAALLSFALHTSPANKDRASDSFRHPRNTDHEKLSFLENSCESLKEGGEKSPTLSETGGEPLNPPKGKTESCVQVNICCKTLVTPQGK